MADDRSFRNESRLDDCFVFPASFAQSRIWLLEQLDPESAAYVLSSSIRFEIDLDAQALQRSLDEIVRRHEMLRTGFTSQDGKPVQVVAPPCSAPLIQADLRRVEQSRRPIESRSLARSVRRPFELSQGPLFRCVLFRFSQASYSLLLCIHHIAADGWSLGVFFRELAQLYSAMAQGRPSPLPALPVQYADFAVWQRRQLEGARLQSLLAYWSERLEGLPPLELHTDHPRGRLADSQAAGRSFAIHGPSVEALSALAQGERCTLFMVLLAAFFALLQRFTGQTDFAVGVPVANRTRSQVEGLIGFFVNTLALRADLRGDPAFRDLMGRVRDTTLEAFAHQDLPFEKLVQHLQPERDLGRNPLVQVSFQLQNSPRFEEGAEALLDLQSGAAGFDLALDLWETEEGIKGALGYRADLFRPESIERLEGAYRNLLDAIASDPDQDLSQLASLSPQEARWINDCCIAPAMPEPAQPAHVLFDRQASQRPTQEALRAGDCCLTYSQLKARADRLAHSLLRLGIKAEDLVGICLERSADLAAAVLGVNKAGGAFLPLHPDLPQERLRFLVAEARPAVVLVDRERPDLSRFLSALPRSIRPLLAHTGSDGCDDPPLPDCGRSLQGCPQGELAYVLYTSGSTGRPKAVAVDHSSLVSRLASVQQHYRYQPHDRVLHFAELSFDASIEELMTPLLAGASVILRPAEPFDSFAALQGFIEAHRLTVLNLPTAYWHAWVDELGRTRRQPPAGVRLVIVGSERAHPDRLRAWQEIVAQGVEWINAYGPSEATITATVYQPCGESLQSPRHPVPIGRPLPGTEIHLLDETGRRTPPGVPGELHLGGVGLARGYWKAPARTAERFVPNPFAADSASSRLYRTGDRARLRPDGNLEFLGRVDEQVQIRGHRVEPAEVEAVLARHPAIAEVAVSACESFGQTALAAYFVERSGHSLETAEARDFLMGRLPPAMVPSAFVRLDSMPLLPAGKVDKRALPPPTYQEASYQEPRNEIERTLVNAWRELLQRDRISVHDDFFELGGHSLLATQLMSRLRDEFSAELPLRCLFEQPTLAGFAALLERRLSQGSSPVQRSIAPQEPSEAERMLEDLETLSEANVDALLEALLEEEGTK